MSNQQILTKAIKKAMRNGWAYFMHEGIADFEIIQPVIMLELLVVFRVDDWRRQVNQEFVIFNHDFAKALWGEDKEGYLKQDTPRDGWQYHLQQMVVAEDPIKYLGEHI